MASAKDIRRRIRTVKNIQKITNAMKMVAAARLRKAQERAEAARPYAQKMKEVMANLAGSAGEINHPLLETREEQNVAYVIIGAERGLAGSYNGNVMHKALREIGERDPGSVRLVVVGKKAVGFFRKRPFDLAETLETSGAQVSFVDIRSITTTVRSLFESGEVDAVHLVYAKFLSAMRQEPVSVKLLPMSAPDSAGQPSGEFIFEPDAASMLAALLPKYLDTQVYQALVEAQASEHGARMTAMSAATTNAGDMIDSLTLTYNKARQAAITKEITEIVGGAEALK